MESHFDTSGYECKAYRYIFSSHRTLNNTYIHVQYRITYLYSQPSLFHILPTRVKWRVFIFLSVFGLTIDISAPFATLLLRITLELVSLRRIPCLLGSIDQVILAGFASSIILTRRRSASPPRNGTEIVVQMALRTVRKRKKIPHQFRVPIQSNDNSPNPFQFDFQRKAKGLEVSQTFEQLLFFLLLEIERHIERISIAVGRQMHNVRCIYVLNAHLRN